MQNQDFGLPLGTAVASAFTPLAIVAGSNIIRGQASRDLFLERIVVLGDAAAPLSGLVSDVKVMKQSVVPSSKGFPVSMLQPNAYDDEALSLGLSIEGGTFVDVEYIAPAAEAGVQLSGFVGSQSMPEGVDVGQDSLDDYSFIFGMGEAILAGAGAWTLESQALRDVFLGRLVLSAPPGYTIESISIAGAEMFSGDGSILVGALATTGTDTDGLTLGKLLQSGESIVIKGQGNAAGGVQAGIYLSDPESII